MPPVRFPGCVAAAATYEECVALMRTAIAGHLEVMREHGEPIPVPSAINVFTVTAA
ncbi:MAG: type II toxin-antitoxin system HicB family antitoxin [Pseudonocardiaceae bacterium]